MRRDLTYVFVIVALMGCGPTKDEVRRLVHEELSNAMQKTIVAPTKTIGPYSPAVRIGNFLFVSGQIGIDQTTGQLNSESFEAETRRALENVRTILHAAGYDSSDVVNATVFLKNMDDFEKMNRVYERFFPEGSYPARTTVGVSELPRGANMEIAVVAYKQ